VTELRRKIPKWGYTFSRYVRQVPGSIILPFDNWGAWSRHSGRAFRIADRAPARFGNYVIFSVLITFFLAEDLRRFQCDRTACAELR
jgi:hypothetical protein